MKKHLIYMSFFSMCLIPAMSFAVEAGMPFGGDVINAHATEIARLLFGPIAKIAAIFGGIAGIIFGYLQQSVMKVLTFGGLMLVSVALPTIINGFYTMLLP
jgi:hypothetical protein